LGKIDGTRYTDPTILSVSYVLSSLFFVICLTISGEMTDAVTIHIFNYSHVAAAVLTIGLVILPARLRWLAFATFALSFVTIELMVTVTNGSSSWSALGMVRGLMVALLVGVIAGRAAHWIYPAAGADTSEPASEESGIFTGLCFAVVGIAIGGVATWIEISVSHVDGPKNIGLALFLQAQRELQLGFIVSAAILMSLWLPKWKALPEIFLAIAAFAAFGQLYAQDMAIFGAFDPLMFAFGLLILRPIDRSIPSILGGFSLYIALTGCFVDLPREMTMAEFRDDALINVFFILMILLGNQRVRSSRLGRIQKQALGRMSRAQELARFGYFLYDFKKQAAFFDPLAQAILDITPQVPQDEFLWRVHPDDRDAVSMGATTRDVDGTSFSFRFSLNGPWVDGCEHRRFSGFARYERAGYQSHVTYGIVVDVSREHAQEEHLSAVLVELSEKQGQQTQIFSMISHELRTPASILSMIADELDEGRSWAEKGPQMRAVMDQLLAILNDMRQTVRPEQNLPIRIEAFRAQDLAEGVKAAFDSMAVARGMTIVLRMGTGAGELRGTDRLRLNQTISNLVKNAIVHSQATEVVIRYDETEGPVAHWRICDNGRNIPLIARETIFHPFVRGDGTGTMVDGSGLGLYIAKEAIELLGGQIEYVEIPLSGAEFHISVPLSTQIETMPTHGAQHESQDHGPSVDLTSRSVLVVEDSETMGDLLVARLERIFGDVVWKRDGTSGLAWAVSNAPSVVITDLFMPGLGGDELVKRLRESGFEGPVIGMTATDIGEEVERFRTSGADEVFTKPINIKTLERVLSKLL
jgi:signal transduction histidine kinase